MEASALYLEPLFNWLLRTTVQAGILVCLILLAQKLLGRWLGVRGRHCLWFLLLLRLALPWAPQSGWSVYNLLPIPSYRGPETGAAQGRLATLEQEKAAWAVTAGGATDVSGEATLGSEAAGSRRGQGTFALLRRGTGVLPVLWLAGAGFLAGCVAVNHIRLLRLVRRGRLVTDQGVLEILEQCRRLLGIRMAVTVTATDEVPCPALCGYLHPRVLLPWETVAESDRNELRHVLLHELAHLKRHDILIGYIAGLLHVLHWFNPLVALGLRRMRADRELVCDGMALSQLGPDEVRAYGHTVVRQIERLVAAGRCPLPTGLCGDPARVKQRIALISRAGSRTPRGSHLTIVLVVCLAGLGLTNGLTANGPRPQGSAAAVSPAPLDQHANVIRIHIRNQITGQYLAADGDRVTCAASEPGEAGVWEARFDDDLGNPDHRVFFYSVAAEKYLTSDDQGRLALDRSDPDEAGRWIVWARPQGAWVVSDIFEDGYLRLDEQGRVRAEVFGRDERSYWSIDQIWRIKVSDDPISSPQWRREKVPGPD